MRPSETSSSESAASHAKTSSSQLLHNGTHYFNEVRRPKPSIAELVGKGQNGASRQTTRFKYFSNMAKINTKAELQKVESDL